MAHTVRTKSMRLAIATTLVATAAAQNGTYSTDSIRWAPCPAEVAAAPVVCGELLVPLDYTNDRSNETLTLQLAKVPAITQPSRGSVLMNFGGPGNDGRTMLGQYAPFLPLGSGGEFDLIAIDPRGTGNTIPFSCYQNETLRRAGQATVRQERANSSDATPGRLWAEAQVLANDCGNALANTTGSLVGTAFVARDFMKVVDALGEDGLIRYWGFSYGSYLGSTIAAMFPDRIDRMVLDGIVNIHEWQAGLTVEAVIDYDKTFKGFLDACVAHPDNCALARGSSNGSGNRTAGALEASLYDLLDRIKHAPFAVGSRIIDYTALQNLINAGLRSPPTWPELAEILDAILDGPDLSRLASLLQNSALLNVWSPGNEAYPGIRCGDQKFRTTDPEALAPYNAARNALSRLGGDEGLATAMQCARWPMAARERYEGDFRVRTRHPILLIGNYADPVTPLASAKNASAGFEGERGAGAQGVWARLHRAVVDLHDHGRSQVPHVRRAACAGHELRGRPAGVRAASWERVDAGGGCPSQAIHFLRGAVKVSVACLNAARSAVH
ncbi:TAP-like protein-domain-containing protein [Apiospora rasikravindrae]|uniref:TAP-like protein-domain-containing protein n=1 Tax=Apiospora rasikravindrae TaxID=990691 RepID=A0ABR1SM27_9PEZI